jgi:hypothetical protein
MPKRSTIAFSLHYASIRDHSCGLMPPSILRKITISQNDKQFIREALGFGVESSASWRCPVRSQRKHWILPQKRQIHQHRLLSEYQFTHSRVKGNHSTGRK